MKKYLIAALMLAGVCWMKANAEMLNTPHGVQQALSGADYGGVYYSTSQFSLALTTVVASGQGVFYGIIWTTGPVQGSGATSEFVDVYDSSGPFSNATQQDSARIYRAYNSGKNSYTVTNSTASGFTGPDYPIRFNRGLRFQPSMADRNCITLLYWTDPDKIR